MIMMMISIIIKIVACLSLALGLNLLVDTSVTPRVLSPSIAVLVTVQMSNEQHFRVVVRSLVHYNVRSACYLPS